MSDLPVREMVLYKHGVGYFVREGQVSGDSAMLTFRHDEINDVLKSLTIFDKAGGHILGLQYQTPMDKVARLANSSIRLSETASLRDLLTSLRGRWATLSFEITVGSAENVTGRVIGLDEPKAQHDTYVSMGDPDASVHVSILAEDGTVRVYPLLALRGMRIHDTQSEYDLAYFLDTSMSEANRRSVSVRLSEGDHDLVVFYVAPSPTWRVSYRIVAESEGGTEAGKALLQGWGLFDNRLDEDLVDVKLTLVAGQPISFIYDLYASRIPERPVVQDEARVAPGPIEFAGAAMALEAPEERARGLAPKALAMQRAAPAPAAAGERQVLGLINPGAIAEAAPTAAEGKETGEFFQYAVTAPVTVKRGDSALVPILNAEVGYQRELLYNGEKLPRHPVAALRFKNSSGLTLERGPVTVVEDGDYRGEAVVAFTKDGNEVYLPYAVELGVLITERPTADVQIAGLILEKAYLIFDEWRVFSTTYVIENTTAKPLTITLEAPILIGREPFETPLPAFESAEFRRWRIESPARSKIEFVRKERMRTRRSEEVRRLDYQRLMSFFENRWLDQSTFDRLSEMLAALALVQRANVEKAALEKERESIYRSSEQLRANLGALQPLGQEAALRNRVLAQLEGAQDRLEAIDKRVGELTRMATDAEARAEAIIAVLGEPPPPPAEAAPTEPVPQPGSMQ